MRVVWIICNFCGLVVLLAEARLTDEDHWNEFKSNFGKVYDQNEEKLRKYIFYENKQFVEANNGLDGVRLEMNKFGDMLHSEFVDLYMGYKGVERLNSVENALNADFLIAEGSGEDEKTIDWREKGYVTGVKDQGACGSCWAFSTTGALEGQTFRKTGKLVDLSEQNLVDCTILAPYDNAGCNGGWMDAAYAYIKDNNGIDLESAYPYEAKDDICRYNSSVSGAIVTGYVDIPTGNDRALVNALLQVGPIAVAIDAGDRTFQFYKDGIYKSSKCSHRYLNHAVLLVGVTKDAYIVKNSWGSGWGSYGYIYMSRSLPNICGISTAASFPLV